MKDFKYKLKKSLALILAWLMIFNIVDYSLFDFTNIKVKAYEENNKISVFNKDTEGYYIFTAEKEGDYLLNAWGAQGGGYNNNGGKGGYSEGIVHLKAGESINVYVGGQGSKENGESKVETYNYTGGMQTFTAPESGYYYFEAWGASGGGNNPGYESAKGLGGYSSGTKYLNKGDKVNIFVGGQGTNGEYQYSTLKNFEYTGNEQTYSIPQDGWYKLEGWGASGGTGNSTSGFGTGGYTSGITYLKKGTLLHIYVGEKGYAAQANSTKVGPNTFNGGGGAWQESGHLGGAGGGATDFRLVGGNWNNESGLQSRILVAGGGGGTGCASSLKPSGNGGGLTGSSTFNNHSDYKNSIAYGGTQSSGVSGNGFYYDKNSVKHTCPTGQSSFGIGANGVQCAAGGGGGYYGGGSCYTAGGGGGSSFVTGYTGCDTTYRAKQGNLNFKNVTLQQGGNNGNGKAKISLVLFNGGGYNGGGNGSGTGYGGGGATDFRIFSENNRIFTGAEDNDSRCASIVGTTSVSNENYNKAHDCLPSNGKGKYVQIDVKGSGLLDMSYSFCNSYGQKVTEGIHTDNLYSFLVEKSDEHQNDSNTNIGLVFKRQGIVIETITMTTLDSRFLIAGGGGGSDDTSFKNNAAGGENDGSGGNGGGTSGENAKIDGVVQNKGNYIANISNGGGCGSGGTQTTGFSKGFGENATNITDTGGAGGGYFGGYVTNHNNGGAGGGSGYIGGVINGKTQSGQRNGNGLAKITYLTGKNNSGGFNGGGSGGVNAFGGGGATDVRLSTDKRTGGTYISNDFWYNSEIWEKQGDNLLSKKAGHLSGPKIQGIKNGYYQVDIYGENLSGIKPTVWDDYLTNKSQNTNWKINIKNDKHIEYFIQLGSEISDSAQTEFCLDADKAGVKIEKIIISPLNSRILVAAGGGGSADNVHANQNFNNGSYGGGLIGGNPEIEANDGNNRIPAKPGTQNAGGTGAINKTTYPNIAESGMFGKGGNGNFVSPNGTISSSHSGGGGGAGYFGGGGSTGWYQGGGAGGSSYIGGVTEGKTVENQKTGNGKIEIFYINVAPVINEVKSISSNIENNELSLNISINITDKENDKLKLYYSFDNSNWINLGENIETGIKNYNIKLNHSDFINEKNIYFKANDTRADSNIYSYKYSTISKTLTSDLINLKDEYSGAIFFGNTSQKTKNYGITQENPSINIDVNRNYLKEVQYILNNSLLIKNTNITLSNNLKQNIHTILPNNLKEENATFKIILTDDNDYMETISTSIDKNKNTLILKENKNPNIINFVLPANEFTQKHIYNKLMINQTKKPTFEWNVNAGNDDYNFGDYIKDVRLKYSVDGNIWYDISNNNLSSINNLEWLNTTSYDNSKVKFKIIAIDSFGEISEQILDNNYYLQLNNKPNAPLSLLIQNLTDNKLFKDNEYKFEWGISTETDITDEIIKYTFGFRTGTYKDGKDDYDNYTKLYDGLNRNYTLTKDDWKKYSSLTTTDSQELTFGVWATDRFGENSLVKTYNISTLNNQAPNKILKEDITISDKSYESINKGFIKRNETYTLHWNDKGDPNTGDKVTRWSVEYSFDNQNWIDLNTITITSLDFNIDSLKIESDKIYFRITAYDSYNLNTVSETLDFGFVTDITGPKWTNINNFLIGDSNDVGQKVSFIAEDISGVYQIQIKDTNGIIIENKLYPENTLKAQLDMILNKNGTYTLIMIDKYLNVSSQSFSINSIDNIAPTIIISSTNTNKTNKDIVVNFNIVDDTKIVSYIVLVKDKVTGNIIENLQFNNLAQQSIKKELTISKNSIITIEAYDKANNKTTESLEINNINKFNPIIVNNYNENVYADMQSKFDIYLDENTINNLKVSKNNIKDTSIESNKIISKDNYKYIVIGTEEELLNITESTNFDNIKLEYWKIKTNNNNYNIYYDNNYKKINFIVNENNTVLNIYFYDAWGNNTSEIITINNIIDGQVEVKTKYLVPYQNYKDKNPAQGDINTIYINSEKFVNDLKNMNYILPEYFVEISKDKTKEYQNVYGYIEIDENFRKIAQVDNFSNNDSIEILKNTDGNPYNAICKFSTTNKTVSFYIKDILNHYIIKRLSIDDIEEESPAIINVYPEKTSLTNKDVKVLFTAQEGWFKNEDAFYQYQKYDENNNLKTYNYYDDFIWYVPKDKDIEYPKNPTYQNLISDENAYYKLYNGTGILDENLQDEDKVAFILNFENNKSFKAWAVNKSDDWIYNYFILTNIDKEKPIINIDNYDNSLTYPDKLYIEAHTNDIFYSKDKIKEIYKNINDNNFIKALDTYDVSSDGKTLTILFDNPLYTLSEFKLYAYDIAGNTNTSINIDLTKIYKTNLNYIYNYKFEDEEIYKEILLEDLLKIRTNKNIDIKIKIDDNNSFIKAEPLYPSGINDNIEILTGLENIIKYKLTKDNSIITQIKDSKNNILDKTFEFNGIINKEKPVLDIIKREILDDNNNYIKTINLELVSNKEVKIIIKDNTTQDILYDTNEYKKEHIYNISKNGEYCIIYTDIYGNEDSSIININNILNEDTKVTINQTISTKNYTNQDITITFNILNGKIKEYTPETNTLKIIERTNNKIVYIASENIEEIKVEAVNYIKEENNAISTVNIYNIDKLPPKPALLNNSITNDGYNSFLIIDGGDEGIGTVKFNYKYNIIGSNEQSGNLNIKNNMLIVNANNINNKGELNLNVLSIDGAGNISSPSNATVKSNDKEILEINTNFNLMIEDLKNNKLTDEKIIFYNQIAQDIEIEVNDGYTYINELQKEYALQKVNDFKTFLGQLEITDEELLNKIKDYFNRLEEDIYDNEFVKSGELQNLMNNIADEKLKESYQKTYDYYYDLINNIFKDNTNDEFNFNDTNGNLLNPLSGYVKNSQGIYGYYNKNGDFIKGKHNQLYYFNSEGEEIQLNTNTYTDGNKNIVNINSGLVNNENYYDENGQLIDYKKYIKGFYDFQGKWHARDSKVPVLNPEFTTPDEPDKPDEPDNPDDGRIYPETITLPYNQLDLFIGDSTTVNATLTPKNVTATKITWSTDNTNVISVNDGKIVALNEGTAVIIAITENNLKAEMNVIVNKKGSNNENEEIIEGTVKPQYPTIDDILEEWEQEEKEQINIPNYDSEEIGNIYFAFTDNDTLSTSEYKGLYEEGYSTVIIDTDDKFDPRSAIDTNMDVGIGNEDFMVIMSNKDITRDMDLDTFKASVTGKKIKLTLYSDYNIERLGNNSYILIVSKDKDLIVTYDGKPISSIYDETLKGYVVKNPLSGTYALEDKPNNYGITSDNTTLSYADLIKVAYNMLNGDDYKDLYSNINESSDVYREASILQRYGIIGKNAKITNTETINGQEAFDIIYLTLNNIENQELNYDSTLFSNLTYVTQQDINNMIYIIKEKDS